MEGVARDGCSRRLEPARGLCADAADHGAAGAADPAEAAAPLLADEPLPLEDPLAAQAQGAGPARGHLGVADDPPLDEPLLDEPEDDPPSEEVDEAADAATDELLEPLPVLLDRESVR